jgi:hypothetical protein
MVKLTHFAQRTEKWLQAHVGIPTASQFHKILTAKTRKPSTQRHDYMYQLLAEWVLDSMLDEIQTDWMERGAELEDDAFRYYEAMREVDVETVGFCLTDDERIGCSPDGLVGEDGGVELKCPTPKVHMRYLLMQESLEDKHRCQVQGCLYVTGREWWDVMSYHPDMPSAIIRVERDPAWMAAFSTVMTTFLGELDTAKDLLLERGIVPKDRPKVRHWLLDVADDTDRVMSAG